MVFVMITEKGINNWQVFLLSIQFLLNYAFINEALTYLRLPAGMLDCIVCIQLKVKPPSNIRHTFNLSFTRQARD